MPEENDNSIVDNSTVEGSTLIGITPTIAPSPIIDNSKELSSVGSTVDFNTYDGEVSVEIKNNNIQNIYDKERSIGYFNLFKYISKKDKILNIFAIIFSVIKGCIFPVSIYFIGQILISLINTVMKNTVETMLISLKAINGKEDDTYIQNLLEVLKSQDSNKIASFEKAHPDSHLQMISESKAAVSLRAMDYKTTSQIWNDILKYYLILFGCALISSLSTFLFHYLFQISASHQSKIWRTKAFKSLITQDITYFEKEENKDIINKINKDTKTVESGIGDQLGTFISSFIIFVGCYVLAIWSSYQLGLPILGASILVIAIILGKSYITHIFKRKAQKAFQYIKEMTQDVFYKIRTVISFGVEKKKTNEYYKYYNKLNKLNTIILYINGLGIAIIMAVVSVSLSLIFIYGMKIVSETSVEKNAMFKVIFGAIIGTFNIYCCEKMIKGFRKAAQAGSRLNHIIEREQNNSSVTSNEKLNGSIMLDKVRFRYENQIEDDDVLKGISFKCEAEKTVAIVGPEHSGKSTLLQLIEKLYNPTKGKIIIDGQDINNYNKAMYYSLVGYVPQYPELFETTIAENISFGSATISQSEIEEAAKLSHAHDFIMSLPNGYQTQYTLQDSHFGLKEKQSIALARALIHHPKILLLDDPYQIIDNSSGLNLKDISEKKTTLIASSNYALAKDADLILVMNDGNIVESGSYNQLMENQGIYYHYLKNEEIAQQINTQRSINNLQHADIINYSHYSNGNNTEKKEDVDKEKEGSKKSINFSYLSKFVSKYIIFIILGFIGSVIYGLNQQYVVHCIVNSILMLMNQSPTMKEDRKHWLTMFFVAGIINFVTLLWETFLFYTFCSKITPNICKSIYEKILRINVSDVDDYNIQKYQLKHKKYGPKLEEGKFEKLQNEAQNVYGIFTFIPFVVKIVLVVVGCIAYALHNYLGFALSLLGLMLVMYTLMGTIFTVKMLIKKKKMSKITPSEEKSFTIDYETVENIKAVQALNINDYIVDRYAKEIVDKDEQKDAKARIPSIIPKAVIGGFYFVFLPGVFCILTLLFQNGVIQFQKIMIAMFPFFYTFINVVINASLFPNIKNALESYRHISEVLDLPETNPDNSSSSSPEMKMQNKIYGDIAMKSLEYQNPDTQKVLDMEDHTLMVNGGKSCIIIGDGKSGKENLIEVLERWHDPQKGTITIDGNDYKSENIQELRQHIAIIDHIPNLFTNVSIKENIRDGQLEATDNEVIEMAKKVNIHSAIASLPEHYNTIIKKMDLTSSNGYFTEEQKMLIAIARALLRKPKILILYHIFQNLAPSSQNNINNILEELSKECTLLIFTDQLNIKKNVDQFVIIDHGKIIEEGSVDEFSANSQSAYYHLNEIQKRLCH